MVKGFCCGHRYCIYPKNPEKVLLNKDDKESQCDIVFGDESIPNVILLWHSLNLPYNYSEYCPPRHS